MKVSLLAVITGLRNARFEEKKTGIRQDVTMHIAVTLNESDPTVDIHRFMKSVNQEQSVTIDQTIVLARQLTQVLEGLRDDPFNREQFVGDVKNIMKVLNLDVERMK